LRSNPSEPDGAAAFAAALDRVRPRLRRLGDPLRCFATIGSTNDAASAIGSEGAVVVADQQTAGRGRRGHVWFSPPGSGLYVSVVLTPSAARVEPDRAAVVLTLASGVAIAEGIEAATGLRAHLKWPNDLFIGRRKLSGILAEAEATHVTLGYGINVGPMAYPRELGDRATSLESELGRPIDRELVFAETIAALDARYHDLLDGRIDAILDAWRLRSPGSRGATVSWTTPAGPQLGRTDGIDDRGALIVRVGDRVERIVAGELTWT
jgi:BirA family biotin operon repressor/biotin-[acetyl-CoA-carboxylase] ligase